MPGPESGTQTVLHGLVSPSSASHHCCIGRRHLRLASHRAIGMHEGKHRNRHRNEKSDHEGKQPSQVYQHEQKQEPEQRPFMPARDAAALLHRLDGTKLPFDHDEGCEHEHPRKDDARHDEQDESRRDRQNDQDIHAEIFPERLGMPQQGEIGRFGAIVRHEIKRRHTHAEQRAERDVDEHAGKRRLLGRAREQSIDAAGEGVNQARDEQDDESRADEEPGPSLERLPAEAKRRPYRESHGLSIARSQS